jgi:hypothetical protein
MDVCLDLYFYHTSVNTDYNLKLPAMEKRENEVAESSVIKRIRRNVKKWIKRFLPAEIIGTLSAIASAFVASAFMTNRVGIAFTASIAETVGFYLAIMVTDALLIRKQLKHKHHTLTLPALLLLIIKNIVLDFGLAELADSFVIRPLFMYLFPLWLNDYTAGIIAGKIASDLVFYVPVIVAGEIRTHISRKRARSNNGD